jgi:hypothetical protein
MLSEQGATALHLHILDLVRFCSDYGRNEEGPKDE